MKITAQEFADMLKNSSLSKKQRMIIVKSLKDMSPEFIEGLVKILKKDSDQVKEIIADLDKNQKAEMKSFEEDLKGIEMEEEK